MAHFTFPKDVESALHARGIHIRVAPAAITFSSERHLTSEELRTAWEHIANALPDLGASAPPNMRGAAPEMFRQKQAALPPKHQKP